MPEASVKNKKYYLLSLGCPKNLADSEKLSSALGGGGLARTEAPEDAEVLIVNTCGFVEDAKRESINEILALARLKSGSGKKKAKKLLVCGCLAGRYKEELKKELPEVDGFWGVDAAGEIAAALGCPEPSGPVERPSTFPYAYLKIAEGCKRRCTFCAIPSIRGPLRNFQPEEIIQQAKAYLDAGIKELILVSQDTASYDFKGYGLPQLVQDMAALENKGDYFRIRLHYLYPSAVNRQLLEVIAQNEKIAPYIDMPLQHSEERILRLMGRGGGAKEIRKKTALVRRTVPGVFIRTSFIVGFPGETEEDFRKLLDFIEEQSFEHAGAFMYSREEGTASAKMPGQLPQSIKQRRYDELMALQAGISLEKNKWLIGKEFQIIIDNMEKGMATGRLPGQSPEVDGVIAFTAPKGKKLKPGDFVNVRVTEAFDYDLKGIIAGD
ncbi:MAG: 30S ribosomal protein S12 methylthiotransferase RimO [Actinomycetota bacterium]|nr:30S ribosomal protein S12 methylthiotransferase RimO [Actinomycetota bacterium]